MDNLEEFSRKYSGTFVQYCDKAGKKHTANVSGAALVEKYIVLELLDGGTVTGSYPRILNNLTLDSPPSGYFNYNGFALYLFKVPARQWQRGMCNANCEVYNPFKRLFTEGVYRPMFGMATANAIFNPGHKTPDEAIDILSKPKKLASVSISRTLAVSKSPLAGNQSLLWYKTNPVGFVEHHKFKVLDGLHEQEVCDELTRGGYHTWLS